METFITVASWYLIIGLGLAAFFFAVASKMRHPIADHIMAFADRYGKLTFLAVIALLWPIPIIASIVGRRR